MACCPHGRSPAAARGNVSARSARTPTATCMSSTAARRHCSSTPARVSVWSTRPLLATRSFGLERVAEVLPLRELYVRLDDGSVRRLTREGQSLDFAVRPPDGALGPLAALAPDREGGLFLADPAHARILQVTAEGAFVRQLRDPALAGIRQLQSSPDGRRLFGLVASG